MGCGLACWVGVVTEPDPLRRGRGRPRLPRFVLAEPELVPITQEQYEQAVTALAGMIVDYWRRHDDRHLPSAPTDPDITSSKLVSWSEGVGVNPPDGDLPRAEE
jgi:hypothetical protein